MSEPPTPPIADVLAACPGIFTKQVGADLSVRATEAQHCSGCASVPRLRAELERLQGEVRRLQGYTGHNEVKQLRADLLRKEAALRALGAIAGELEDAGVHPVLVTKIRAALGGTDG